jgi:hypothetical protein
MACRLLHDQAAKETKMALEARLLNAGVTSKKAAAKDAFLTIN